MNRHVTLHSQADKQYVASATLHEFIHTPQDFLDLLAWGGENGTTLFLLRDVNFGPGFYNLKTGLAGEVLQKLSNYTCRLAIEGTFDLVVSERFRELMSESNKGSHVRFARSREEAISWLVG